MVLNYFQQCRWSVVAGKLFHRVILMSGSALSPWAVVRDTVTTTSQVSILCTNYFQP
jgi:hypothetical protein